MDGVTGFMFAAVLFLVFSGLCDVEICVDFPGCCFADLFVLIFCRHMNFPSVY